MRRYEIVPALETGARGRVWLCPRAGQSPWPKRLLAGILVVVGALLGTLPAFAHDHSCPGDRPYPRGESGCDSCDAEALLRQYHRGELSETRASRVFDHEIRVTVFCDDNRHVNVGDVFSELRATEEVFMSLLGRSVDRADGLREVEREDGSTETVPRINEIVVGICDGGDGVDDCAMKALCVDKGWGGCDVLRTGRSYRDEVVGHMAFTPWAREGVHWWVLGNRYGNLQHEHTHLLDYTYVRQDWRTGTDQLWWNEGLPQYVQSLVLGEILSWQRGNYDATLLDVFKFRARADPYYEGLRVFAYLAENDPWTLERMADVVKSGIYTKPSRHQYWYDLLGHAAWRHQRAWEWWNSVKDDEYNTNASPVLTHSLTGEVSRQPEIMGRASAELE